MALNVFKLVSVVFCSAQFFLHSTNATPVRATAVNNHASSSQSSGMTCNRLSTSVRARQSNNALVSDSYCVKVSAEGLHNQWCWKDKSQLDLQSPNLTRFDVTRYVCDPQSLSKLCEHKDYSRTFVLETLRSSQLQPTFFIIRKDEGDGDLVKLNDHSKQALTFKRMQKCEHRFSRTRNHRDKLVIKDYVFGHGTEVLFKPTGRSLCLKKENTCSCVDGAWINTTFLKSGDGSSNCNISELFKPTKAQQTSCVLRDIRN